MFNVIKQFGLVVDDVGGWIDMIVIVQSVMKSSLSPSPKDSDSLRCLA